MEAQPYSLLDDNDPFGYAKRRRMAALSPTVPPAALNPSGASYGALTGHDDSDDPVWWGPKLDPAANRISSLPGLSSSGPAGTGQSAQPQADLNTGDVSADAGKVLNGAAKKMPPPGMPAASDDPGAAGLPPVQAQPAKQSPPGVSPQVQQIEQRMAERAANPPKQIGERPQDFDPDTGKEKLGAKAASWGQRLALALLSATKLAPYAQQIVRPQWSEQVAANQIAEKTDEAQLKGLESAANTNYLGGLREAQAQDKLEHANLEQTKAAPHYGQSHIDASQAHYFPLHVTDPDGSVWVNSAEALEKEKELGKNIIVKQDETVLDPSGKPIFTAPTKPKTITNLTEKWIADNPNGTADQLGTFLQTQNSAQFRPTLTDLGLRAAGINTGHPMLDVVSPEEAQRAIEFTKDKSKGGEQGTWQIAEDAAGAPVLFNSKTSETKPVSGLQKSGTKAKGDAATEKLVGPARDAQVYAQDYLDRKVYTGPGDEALMEKFFELAKPSTGFRMSQQQMDMLKNAQSWMNSASAKIRHATAGTWFSDDLRSQIVDTMKNLATAKLGAHPVGSVTPGAPTAPGSRPPLSNFENK